MSLEAALIKQKQDQPQSAAADLLQLAELGDSRAQYLLGVAYLKGDGVKRDYIRGYGWLQIAAAPYPGQYGGATDEAAGAIRQVEPQLSGSDLIHGDRFAAEFRDRVQQETDAATARAGRAMTETLQGANPSASERRTDGGPYPGCGLDESLQGCPPVAKSDNCKGPLVKPDVPVSEKGSLVSVPRPEYPVEARRKAWEGSIGLLLHVGLGGEVCQVMRVKSSGIPELDEAALQAAKLWRLMPATLAGKPVEALDSRFLVFQLSDYVFK